MSLQTAPVPAPDALETDIKFYVAQLPQGLGAPQKVSALDAPGRRHCKPLDSARGSLEHERLGGLLRDVDQRAAGTRRCPRSTRSSRVQRNVESFAEGLAEALLDGLPRPA